MAGPSLAYTIYRSTWEMLDWVFPPRCAGCDRPGIRWCQECQAEVNRLGESVCPSCGMPGSRGSMCRVCEAHPPLFQALRSWAAFQGPLQKAIHNLKYRRDIAIGESLAESMLPDLNRLGWPVDLVVPVPLGRSRQFERGYNQASLIARPIAMALRLTYAPGALFRSRETRSQVGLSREQRRENVKGVFRARSKTVNGHTVLLIDDVATTGSTLSSAAEALLAAGAVQVYAFTAARAIPTTAA